MHDIPQKNDSEMRAETTAKAEVSRDASLNVIRCGLVPYGDGEALQRDYWERRRENEIGDTLLLLEHPAVVTLGVRKQSAEDVLFSADDLKKKNIELITTDRGGLATLHAPGQVVGYFFVRLNEIQGGLRSFIRFIEDGIIETCAQFSVQAESGREEPGVWIGPRKLASLGIAVRRGITRHGFALNVCNDLSLFSVLRPCGFSSTVMSSLEVESGRSISTGEVIRAMETIYPGLLAERKIHKRDAT